MFNLRIPVSRSIGLVLLFLSGWVAAQPPDQRKGERQRPEQSTAMVVNVPAVTLNVTVTDRRGNLITGLGRDNFQILENGKPETISHFFPDEAPINVVLLLEISQQIYGLERDYWTAVMDFANALRPDDYLALVTYDMKPRIAVDFTRDKRRVTSEANVSLYYKGFNESNLSDAIVFVLEALQEVEGKKAILLLSTGLDTFSKTNYNNALRMAEESDTVIYAISMGQFIRDIGAGYRQTFEAELKMADVRLRSFSTRTGGEAFFPRFVGAYAGIFRNILMYMRYQYTLAYTPSDQSRKTVRRKIKVEANADIDGDGKPDKLVVRHKDGYRLRD